MGCCRGKLFFWDGLNLSDMHRSNYRTRSVNSLSPFPPVFSLLTHTMSQLLVVSFRKRTSTPEPSLEIQTLRIAFILRDMGFINHTVVSTT